MTLLRALLIAWLALGAPLTAAAGHRCGHMDSATSAQQRHSPAHKHAVHDQGARHAGHANAHAHHRTADSPGNQLHHDHRQLASETTSMNCCDGACACPGQACASVPGALVLGAAPVPLPCASPSERFVAPRAEDPAPGHPHRLLRPPA